MSATGENNDNFLFSKPTWLVVPENLDDVKVVVMIEILWIVK